eukprot:TRINITY_DN22574_c0_g1_i2.p2 TRINITY_DN22574_c0_g1~~TRINITY_DN22574_c0_g1_i2.p2  ORF type:complete len:230 (+),score=50.09 TRINITY_DN22574_c0_g1_i2:55-744(+)
MVFFFQAEDGIRDAQESRGLGDVYKRQQMETAVAQAFCVAGAGEETLYKLRQDITDATSCFERCGIPAGSIFMDDVGKAALLEALREQWSCPETTVFFLYYAGHGKRGGSGPTEGVPNIAGAWMLDKATSRESRDQTVDDLFSQDELYQLWRESRVNSVMKPSSLHVMLDCCYTVRWAERQRKFSLKERQELRCSITPIKISYDPEMFEAAVWRAISTTSPYTKSRLGT